MCAFVGKTASGPKKGQPLTLSWWPLGRDAIFYNISVIFMTFAIFDGVVTWVESVCLMIVYSLYVVVMKHNGRLSKWTEKQLANTGKPRGIFADGLKLGIESKCFTGLVYLMIVGNVAIIILDFSETCGSAVNMSSCTGPGAVTKFCNIPGVVGVGSPCCQTKEVLDSMNHMFNAFFITEFVGKHVATGAFAYWRDPLNAFDGILVLLSIIEYGLTLTLLGSGGSGGDQLKSLKSLRMFRFFRALRALRILRFAKLLDKKEAKAKRMSLSMEAHSLPAKTTRGGVRMQVRKNSALPIRKRRLSSIVPTPDGAAVLAQLQAELEGKGEEDDEEDSDAEPVALEDELPVNPFEKPGGCCGNSWWITTLPLALLICITIPDVRRERFKKFSVLAFIMSLIWIFALSFLMVWMASEVGTTLDIPPQIVGLTLLAIGTSVPDLLSSMSVARQGFGDMAVSNCIGSNIFDMLIGLPLPWFIFSAVYAPLMQFCTLDVTSTSKSLNIQVLLIFVVVSALMLGVLFFCKLQ